MINPVIPFATPISRFAREFLAWRRSPNKVEAIKRIRQCIALNKLERVIALSIDVNANDPGLGPSTMQAHRSATASTAQIQNCFRLFWQFASPSVSAFSLLSTWVLAFASRRVWPLCVYRRMYLSLRQPLLSTLRESSI
jgi:hypothetical protein